jgi:hypothetical protein
MEVKVAHVRVWEWDVDAPFFPHYDATASPNGLAYGCAIKGPFCGWDAQGSQTWAEFLAHGPPAEIEMPAAIAAEIRAFALVR